MLPNPSSTAGRPVSPQEEMHQNTIPVESCHRHDRYYLEDGVIFRVQNTLFKVPRYMLVHESSVFEGMFHMPNIDSAEGIVDTAPIRLPQVEVMDFERLLELLYPLEFNKFTAGTNCWSETEWKSILYLASMWQMEDLRSQAIRKLDSCARPSTKIRLGRDYVDLAEWIFDSYLRLCLQEKPLTMEDTEGLTVKEIVGIAEARERIRLNMLKSTCKEIVSVTIHGQISSCYHTRHNFAGAAQNVLIRDMLVEIFDIKQSTPIPGC